MKVSINKSEIKGKVVAPSSKSYTIRGLMCAALADGESKLLQPLSSDDTEAAIDVLSKIGVNINQTKNWWRIRGDNFHKPDDGLFCRDSAATMRFITAICATVPGKCRVVPSPALAKRPINILVDALKQLGVDCHIEDSKVLVNGGKLQGGVTSLAGNISSQYVSALLLVSPFAEDGVTIKLTTPLESKPYVLMTIECLNKFGIEVKSSQDLREFEVKAQKYKPAVYQVEGDWSSASYLLSLGALSGEVQIKNLNTESLQGDRIILRLLQEMGASINMDKNSVVVSRNRLKAIKADLTDCIDLLPTMAVLAAVAEGKSKFTGIERARLKESNRVAAVKDGLEKMGIKVTEEKNKLTITGAKPEGASIDSWGDHRIAMAFSMLGTVVGGVTIDNAECVAKTYPEFWKTLESMGGKVTTYE